MKKVLLSRAGLPLHHYEGLEGFCECLEGMLIRALVCLVGLLYDNLTKLRKPLRQYFLF